MAAIAGAMVAGGGLATQAASATAPVISTEPGGVIRADIAPDESWTCGGWSLQPPFVNSAPTSGVLRGPVTGRMTFTPGSDVWVFCTRSWVMPLDLNVLVHPELDWNHVIRTEN
ncbi:hypothetical protein GCM10027167_26200 [Nocardia heshunensis]